jgi:hypothetical protein
VFSLSLTVLRQHPEGPGITHLIRIYAAVTPSGNEPGSLGAERGNRVSTYGGTSEIMKTIIARDLTGVRA